MAADRNKTIELLGDMMFQAARASVVRGAQFEPGEPISDNAEGAWHGIAEAIVGYIDQRLGDAQPPQEVTNAESP